MHLHPHPSARARLWSRLLLLGSSLALLISTPLLAHGTLLQPMSRVYRVYKDNPENPTAAWAKAAMALSDKNAIYTWNQISQNIPSHNHRAAIPNGQFASGGNPLYAGLDLVRPDWPATPVAPGNFQLLHWATAPHEPSYFDVYLTKANYDPSQPLTWDNLEQIGRHVPYWKEAPGYWRLNITLPPRTGKHVLWVVWQRIDPVGEAFFMTSDIVFDGSVTENEIVPLPGSDPTLPDYDPDPDTDPVDPVDPSPVPPYVAPTPPPAIQTQIGDARVEFSSTEAWIGGYNATLRITNLGTRPLDDWKIGFTGEFVITSLWNGRYLCAAADHTVANPAWAPTLAPGATATVGFIVSGPLVAPANFTVAGQTSTPPPPPPPPPAASFAVELHYDSVWTSGFTGTLRVKNTGTAAVDGWTLAFAAPFEITSLWNGTYQKVDDIHTATPASWNRRIAPGQSINLGFTARGNAAPIADAVVRTVP